jgi:hypothetical protein
MDSEASCSHCCRTFRNERALISHRSKNADCFENFSTHLAGTSKVNQTQRNDGNRPNGESCSTRSSNRATRDFEIVKDVQDGFLLNRFSDNGSSSNGSDDDPSVADAGDALPHDAADEDLEVTPLHYESVGGVLFTADDTSSLKLLKLLMQGEAPLYFFEAIQKWAFDAWSCGATFRAVPHVRQKYLDDLSGRLSMEKLRPFPKFVQLTNGSRKAVYCFPFVEHVKSLLDDQFLMQQENCLFSFNDPFAIQEDTGVRADVNCSRFWHETQKEMCTGPTDFFAPLVLFIDSTPIDMYGKVSVEPLMMTGGWFKRSVRTKAHAWRPIGLLPNLKVKSRAQSKASSKSSIQEYHTALSVILEEMKQVHEIGGFPHALNLGGKFYDVTVKCPIMVIIGDAKGNNSLCGAYSGSKSAHLCRECDVSFESADDPFINCHRVLQEDVQTPFKAGERRRLREMSYHFVENAFWDLQFGSSGHGIYQHCPPENLHSIKEGLFDYFLNTLVSKLEGTKALSTCDTLFQEMSRHCQHQSDRDFPRCHFPFGFSNVTKVTGDEKEGVVIVLVLVMESVGGKAAFLKGGLGGQYFRRWLKLSQEMLMYHSWMCKDKYDRSELDSACARIREFLSTYKKVLNREEGYGMKIQKFHQQIHGPMNIDFFGSPKNVDGRPCEKNLKYHAKAPGRSTQKRMETFHKQCADRIFDRLVVQRSLRDHLNDEIVGDEMEERKELTSVKEGKLLCGSCFTISLIHDESCDGQLIVSVDGPVMGSDESASPFLSDDVVGFVAKHVAQFCSSMTVTIWSDHVRDGVIIRGHPKYRNGQSWNDWVIIEWLPSSGNEDSGSPSLVEGQIYGFLDLTEFNFNRGPGELTHVLENGTCGQYAIVHSLRSPARQSYENSIVKKGLLELAADGSRKFRLVDVESISDVCFGVPDLSGPPGSVLILTRRRQWAEMFVS